MSKENLKKESYLFILPWELSALGGVNQVVENLYRQMEQGGRFNPMIMVNSWGDVRFSKKEVNGIEHFFFRLRSPWDSAFKIYNCLAYSFDLLRMMWRFSRFIKENRISVVNVHYCSLSAFTIIIMKCLNLFNGSLLLSFHGKDLFDASRSRGMENRLWKMMLAHADRIVACSQFLKNEIVKLYINSSDKIATIHNGVDVTLPARYISQYNRVDTNNHKYILNVATLQYQKGQDILLQAFGQIAQDFNDVNLIIVGRPGGVEQQIKEAIESLGLSQRVRLYEGLSHGQVMAFMARATVFALPSRYESFGIVVLEAGVFGVPVIATNVGGIREILSHNETGRLCEPGDTNSFAQGLRELLADAGERKRLGDNLRNHVFANFSWEKTYQSYLACIGA